MEDPDCSCSVRGGVAALSAYVSRPGCVRVLSWGAFVLGPWLIFALYIKRGESLFRYSFGRKLGVKSLSSPRFVCGLVCGGLVDLFTM